MVLDMLTDLSTKIHHIIAMDFSMVDHDLTSNDIIVHLVLNICSLSIVKHKQD